jgi:hypothetical protein
MLSAGNTEFHPSLHKIRLLAKMHPKHRPLTIGDGLELRLCPELGPCELGLFATRDLHNRHWTYFDGLLHVSAAGTQLLLDMQSHAIAFTRTGRDVVLGVRAVAPMIPSDEWVAGLNQALKGVGAASFANACSNAANASRGLTDFLVSVMEPNRAVPGGGEYQTAGLCSKPVVLGLLPLRMTGSPTSGTEILWDYKHRGAAAPSEMQVAEGHKSMPLVKRAQHWERKKRSEALIPMGQRLGQRERKKRLREASTARGEHCERPALESRPLESRAL